MIDQYLQPLMQALESERGIALKCEEPQRLIYQLHQARKKANNAALDALVIAVSRTSPSDEVWIVHQKEDSPDAPQEPGPT